MKTLKAYRESKGVKLSSVAEHLGVTRQTYSGYEDNQEAMSISQAIAVCEYLGCSVDAIFLPKDVK